MKACAWTGVHTKKTFLMMLFILLVTGCASKGMRPPEEAAIDRESRIPSDAVKMTSLTDAAQVKSLSPEYDDPVPLPYPINTAGAEDSPFVMPDGDTLYFFFTPDVRVPAERQLLDGVTGIYVSHKKVGSWGKPERVVLQDKKKLSLDGCLFILEDKAWFCSAREGYAGIHWFAADYADGKWKNWRNADEELKTDEYKTGELHISSDGLELYFHADGKAGGKGGRDIWVSKKVDGAWGEPENVAAVNTKSDDGYPALSPDGNELWLTRDYGVWRAKKAGGVWQTPEQMFSPLAGEASVDSAGNVYFVHHFFKQDRMIEADIYVAYKK